MRAICAPTRLKRLCVADPLNGSWPALTPIPASVASALQYRLQTASMQRSGAGQRPRRAAPTRAAGRPRRANNCHGSRGRIRVMLGSPAK